MRLRPAPCSIACRARRPGRAVKPRRCHRVSPCSNNTSVLSVPDCLSSQTYAKKKKNPQPNSSGFAYVRAALELALEISFGAVNALAFSISKHIRIEYNICYSVVFFFFVLDLRAKLLFLNILKLF